MKPGGLFRECRVLALPGGLRRAPHLRGSTGGPLLRLASDTLSPGPVLSPRPDSMSSIDRAVRPKRPRSQERDRRPTTRDTTGVCAAALWGSIEGDCPGSYGNDSRGSEQALGTSLSRVALLVSRSRGSRDGWISLRCLFNGVLGTAVCCCRAVLLQSGVRVSGDLRGTRQDLQQDDSRSTWAAEDARGPQSAVEARWHRRFFRTRTRPR